MASDAVPQRAETVLLIDLAPEDAGGQVAPDATLMRLRFRALDAGALAARRPDRVICALVPPGPDAAQVIARLEELGYGGRITVLAPPLPDRRMVERELRSMGPATRLDLVEI